MTINTQDRGNFSDHLEEFTVVSVAEPLGKQLNAMEGRVTRGGGGGVWLGHINQPFN